MEDSKLLKILKYILIVVSIVALVFAIFYKCVTVFNFGFLAKFSISAPEFYNFIMNVASILIPACLVLISLALTLLNKGNKPLFITFLIFTILTLVIYVFELIKMFG